MTDFAKKALAFIVAALDNEHGIPWRAAEALVPLSNNYDDGLWPVHDAIECVDGWCWIEEDDRNALMALYDLDGWI